MGKRKAIKGGYLCEFFKLIVYVELGVQEEL